MKLVHAKSVSLTLITLGLVISFYLLWRHLVLLEAGQGAGVDMCIALFGKGCDSVLKGPASSLWGLPLAGWGLTYFATLAVLLLLGQFLGKPFQFEATLVALLLAVGAALAGVFLTGLMLSPKVSFCPLCAVIHLINFGMVFALYRLIGRPIGQLTQAVRAAGTYLWTGRTIDPVQARWKLVGLLTVLLCGVVLSQRILLIAAPHREAVHPSLDPRELLAEFEAGPELSIPVGPDDPVLGPADAPAQIVVFSDFQCPACRRHAKNLHALYEKNEAKLQIVFKHYPLNKACNPSLNRDLHPQACEAAYAAEAARRQGKFWPFHDELFVPGVEFDGDTLRSIAESLDLDVQRFETERLDQKTQAKVRSDIALARQLEVRGTPTLFLNKRRLPNINSRAVKILVEKVSSRESR